MIFSGSVYIFHKKIRKADFIQKKMWNGILRSENTFIFNTIQCYCFSVLFIYLFIFVISFSNFLYCYVF